MPPIGSGSGFEERTHRHPGFFPARKAHILSPMRKFHDRTASLYEDFQQKDI
jgi:hypothetical protein